MGKEKEREKIEIESEESLLDSGTLKMVALALFAATYIALLAFPRIRAFIAAGSAVIFVLIGALPVGEVISTIDWNVLMMIAGTMGTVYLFIESKMPSLMADVIIDKVPNVKWAVISLALFAGIISAFVDNVATVLMVAPVALNISKKLGISPVPSVISIAISSNLQGAATLVGDTTSILLGGHAGLDFLDFFVYQGRPGMFWVVQVGALVSTVVLLILFRKEDQPVSIEQRTVVEDYFPSILLSGTVVLLILASFLPTKPDLINGYICVGLFLIGLLRNFLRTKDASVFTKALKEIDFFTLLLLAGLFVVIGGITEVGIVDDIGQLFLKLTDDPFIIFTLLVWISVLLSAFIDNIPYVATMLPVVGTISSSMGVDPTLFYFGLLAGATLGGNLTPIGASANITGLGILRKDGYEVKAGTFMKISVPFALSAGTSGYILLWLIWG